MILIIGLTLWLRQEPVNAQATPVQYEGPSLVSVPQPPTLKNTETTSGANAAQTKSIAAVASQSVKLFRIHYVCSAGTATLTIKDGVAGTTIWSYPATVSQDITFSTPLTSTSGNGMDITVGTCGTSNTSILDVQASQF